MAPSFLRIPFRHKFALSLLLALVLPAAARADIYRILSGERESLQCRFDLVAQAKEEVLLSTFIIKDDLVGRAVLQGLIEAAARGVKVRVILDDMGQRLPVPLLLYLEEQHIDVRIFNIRRYTNFRSIVDRMHEKVLITDARNLIVGGRNLKEEYFLLDSIVNFLDREVLVQGKLATGKARAHFYTVLSHPKLVGKTRRQPLADEERAYWRKVLGEAPGEVEQRLKLDLHTRRDWAAGVPPTANSVYFVHDNLFRKDGKRYVHRKRKDRECTRVLMALVDSAKTTLDIENAYFMPTRGWWKTLKRAQKRGVKIRVFTNSDYTSDVPLVQSVYALKRNKYRRAGLELWEYRGAKMVHIKAMTIDRRVAVIGSYNLDRKSEFLNTEVITYVDDPRIAGEQLRILDRLLRTSAVRVGDPASAEGKVLPQLTELQKKRKCRVSFFRWTLAPLADIVF